MQRNLTTIYFIDQLILDSGQISYGQSKNTDVVSHFNCGFFELKQQQKCVDIWMLAICILSVARVMFAGGVSAFAFQRAVQFF